MEWLVEAVLTITCAFIIVSMLIWLFDTADKDK